MTATGYAAISEMTVKKILLYKISLVLAVLLYTVVIELIKQN